MKVNYVKLTAGVLTGFMALSSVPYAVYAAGPTAGVASYTSDIVSTSNTLTAGVTSMLTDVMLKGDETSETATDVATTDAEPVKSAYADTAVAQVSDSVIYVRVQMKTASLLESSITMELEQYLRQPITDGTKPVRFSNRICKRRLCCSW